MKEETIKRTMTYIMFLGLALVIVAICLAVFAKLHLTMGMQGIMIIVLTAGSGLILLLPSKIFLTLLLMKNDKK
jgi:hypothetical protein